MNNSGSPPIALALSGGGVRAMVFHLGVLQFLAERQLLERVSRISTVSGGSLLVGLMLQENMLRWPSSKTFSSVVLPNLRTRLCASSMQWGAMRQLRHPRNWQFLFARANLLALALENEWGVTGKLSDLNAIPEWSVNGTTAETGKRFRFKAASLGDYSLGYASTGDFPLSSALAVSAAFPGGFGPFKFDAHLFQWERRPWGTPAGQEEPVDIGYQHLHLYDGGVYDNLGLEPFFDSGRGKSKLADECIVVSDAGAPLVNGFSMGALNPFRLKRVADIMSDQSRALRVRTFAHYIQQAHGRGAYLYINTPVRGTAASNSVEFAASFPTTLRRLKDYEFDKLFEHGHRVACQVEDQYGIVGEPSSAEEKINDNAPNF